MSSGGGADRLGAKPMGTGSLLRKLAGKRSSSAVASYCVGGELVRSVSKGKRIRISLSFRISTSSRVSHVGL
jgi:hypothetical protein